MATSVNLAYQVPAMTSAGLGLAAASFWAGFRGFAQLGGRLPLMPIVDRVGVTRAMRVAYLSIAFGMAALAFAGTPLLAAVYALAAGFGIGALSPLVGMFSSELFGTRSLGTAMGTVSLVFFGAGALGAPVAAVVATRTGSRSTAVLGAAFLALMAAVVLSPPSSGGTSTRDAR
jgi:MFS family permease